MSRLILISLVVIAFAAGWFSHCVYMEPAVVQEPVLHEQRVIVVPAKEYEPLQSGGINDLREN